MAPRSRAHLCFTMVEGSNRRREGGDVSRGFRVSRVTDWQGPIGFFVASPFPTWRRTQFPSTLNSCPQGLRIVSRYSGCGGNPAPFSCAMKVVPTEAVGREAVVHPASRRCHDRAGVQPGLWIPAAAGMTGRGVAVEGWGQGSGCDCPDGWSN